VQPKQSDDNHKKSNAGRSKNIKPPTQANQPTAKVPSKPTCEVISIHEDDTQLPEGLPAKQAKTRRRDAQPDPEEEHAENDPVVLEAKSVHLYNKQLQFCRTRHHHARCAIKGCGLCMHCHNKVCLDSAHDFASRADLSKLRLSSAIKDIKMLELERKWDLQKQRDMQKEISLLKQELMMKDKSRIREKHGYGMTMDDYSRL
jgi:hypothetical protein